MSRVSKNPINNTYKCPKSVYYQCVFSVKGPLGTLQQALTQDIIWKLIKNNSEKFKQLIILNMLMHYLEQFVLLLPIWFMA